MSKIFHTFYRVDRRGWLITNCGIFHTFLKASINQWYDRTSPGWNGRGGGVEVGGQAQLQRTKVQWSDGTVEQQLRLELLVSKRKLTARRRPLSPSLFFFVPGRAFHEDPWEYFFVKMILQTRNITKICKKKTKTRRSKIVSKINSIGLVSSN